MRLSHDTLRQALISAIAVKKNGKNWDFDGIRTSASQILVGRHYQLKCKTTRWVEANLEDSSFPWTLKFHLS